MEKNKIYQIVQEEVQKMIRESKENSPKLREELEKLRKKFEGAMVANESLGTEVNAPFRKSKRVQLTTVAELLDVPVSELMLYFMNEVKGSNDRSLVEYHLGLVYFFSE